MSQKHLHCSTATIPELQYAFNHGKPISGITFIGTHYGPHNDELLSGFLLQTTPQGKSLFPGIEKVVFGQITPTHLRNKHMLGTEGFFKALKLGILLIGVGGGPFDEHGNRNEKISCTELVVIFLGLRNEKSEYRKYRQLVDYVNFEDGHGDNAIGFLNSQRKPEDPKLTKMEAEGLKHLQSGAFAQHIKEQFELAGDDEEYQGKIFAEAFAFYESKIKHAQLFAKAEHAYTLAKKEPVDISLFEKTNNFVVLILQSNVVAINKVAFNKWSTNADKKLGVLFLHKPNGQFVLMPNTQYIKPIQMKEVVKIIRQTIGFNLNFQKPISFSELGKNEWISLVPEIYFDENTGTICNGSKVDPDVPGLIGNVISIEEIIDAIVIGLEQDCFPKKFSEGCKNGICAKFACPFYQFGLKRCFEIRTPKLVNTDIEYENQKTVAMNDEKIAS